MHRRGFGLFNPTLRAGAIMFAAVPQFDYYWLAVALWLLIYPFDFYLTMYGNQQRIKNAQDQIKYEGSYELNPIFQKDVNLLRWLSPRFFLMLILWPALF